MVNTIQDPTDRRIDALVLPSLGTATSGTPEIHRRRIHLVGCESKVAIALLDAEIEFPSLDASLNECPSRRSPPLRDVTFDDVANNACLDQIPS